MSDLPPRRKKLLVLSIIMMALVIVVALTVAFRGQDIYMSSQGYLKVCSPLPDYMACQYCKCARGDVGPGFGGASCGDGSKPICESVR